LFKYATSSQGGIVVDVEDYGMGAQPAAFDKNVCSRA